jgi:integrase
MPKKLTQLMIKRLSPPKQRQTVSDTIVPGLQLRYWKHKKDPTRVDGAYSIRYRSPVTGKQTRDTIGSIHNWALDEARDHARGQFKLIDTGKDPKLEQQRAVGTAPGTFASVLSEFTERYLKPHRKDWPKSEKMLLRNFIETKPSWADIPIHEITRGDINAKLDRLADQGKHVAANRLYEHLRVLFDWAVSRGYINTSPMVGMKKPFKEKPRQRVLDDDEIRRVWTAFGNLGFPFGPMYKMLLLTGQRISEVAGMKWAAVDLDKRLWTLKAMDNKSGRHYICPLSSTAINILESIPREGDSPLVFTTGRTSNPASGFSKVNERVRRYAGVYDWRPHDFRRALRTNLSKLGVQPHIAELVLNHSVKGLQATYDVYQYIEEKADALERWSERLMAIAEDKSRAEVVAIR